MAFPETGLEDLRQESRSVGLGIEPQRTGHFPFTE
jgi:hypothetical protein